MVESEWNIYKGKPVQIKAKRIFERFEVQTLEGLMQGQSGDWLIEGTEGEKYPCKDSVFKRKYEWVKKSINQVTKNE